MDFKDILAGMTQAELDSALRELLDSGLLMCTRRARPGAEALYALTSEPLAPDINTFADADFDYEKFDRLHKQFGGSDA
jgi:hypothetical protein